MMQIDYSKVFDMIASGVLRGKALKHRGTETVVRWVNNG